MATRFQDTFTDANGTNLASHTPDLAPPGSGPYAEATGGTGSQQIQSNALFPNFSGVPTNTYWFPGGVEDSSGNPVTTVDVAAAFVVGTGGQLLRVLLAQGQSITGQKVELIFDMGSKTLSLVKLNSAGSSSTIISTSLNGYAAGTTVSAVARVRIGNVADLWINGVLKGTTSSVSGTATSFTDLGTVVYSQNGTSGSSLTGVTLSDPTPINTVAPAITGLTPVGSTLTCSNGTWTDSPTSYTYAWTRDGATIGGATNAAYVTQTADKGHVVGCVVTAHNANGAPPAGATATGPVTPVGAPVNTAAPVITGTAAVGATLTVSTPGVYTGPATPTGYQWRYSTNSGSTWTNIPGAISTSYTVASAYAGDQIDVLETATNAAGTATAPSNAITIPPPPTNLTAPLITPATGPWHTLDVLTCSAGTWDQTPDTVAYQWYDNGVPIGGAATNQYTLATVDEGHNSPGVQCQVTVTHAGSTASAFSSNAITPDVTHYLDATSGSWRYTGGSTNDDPSLSLGGTPGATVQRGTLGSIWGEITGPQALNGVDLYVDLVVQNNDSISNALQGLLYVVQQFAHPGLTGEVGISVAKNTTSPARVNLTTAPSGVTAWTSVTIANLGIGFGDLNVGDWRVVHLHLNVAARTDKTLLDATDNAFNPGVQFTGS